MQYMTTLRKINAISIFIHHCIQSLQISQTEMGMTIETFALDIFSVMLNVLTEYDENRHKNGVRKKKY